MNRLFVYGIFLGKGMRDSYGMSNAEYQTVDGYVTVGHRIVRAVPAPRGYALTGLVVDVDPSKWEEIDSLERGYDRKIVTTTSNEHVYMYVGKARDDR